MSRKIYGDKAKEIFQERMNAESVRAVTPSQKREAKKRVEKALKFAEKERKKVKSEL